MDLASVSCIPHFPTLRSSTASSIMVLDIRLESESELSDLTESESSGQMELTASCQDTPDTETSSLESEYSVGSSASSIPTLPEISSGPEDSHEIFQFNTKTTRKCLRCHVNSQSSPFPFCRKCYMDRKRFFPPRPSTKRKRTSTENNCPASKRTMLSDSSQSDPPHLDSKPSVCGCCLDAPCNGVFIHGEVGHQLFCYKCAHRVWLERKLCPYCNRPISKVVKLFRVDME